MCFDELARLSEPGNFTAFIYSRLFYFLKKGEKSRGCWKSQKFNWTSSNDEPINPSIATTFKKWKKCGLSRNVSFFLCLPGNRSASSSFSDVRGPARYLSETLFPITCWGGGAADNQINGQMESPIRLGDVSNSAAILPHHTGDASV
jgi:hypothetical protein